MTMVMTHYMELLSLHQPWFLILFMLVPMVLAETILRRFFSVVQRRTQCQVGFSQSCLWIGPWYFLYLCICLHRGLLCPHD